MNYEMFYADYCEGKEILSDQPCTRTKEEILHSMDCVLHMPNNFLGIVDKSGTTLQFMVNQDKTVAVDIPQVPRQGSLTKTVELSQCLELVRELGECVDPNSIEGLEFTSW